MPQPILIAYAVGLAETHGMFDELDDWLPTALHAASNVPIDMVADGTRLDVLLEIPNDYEMQPRFNQVTDAADVQRMKIVCSVLYLGGEWHKISG